VVRENAEEKQSSEANIAHKTISVKYRNTLNTLERDSWVKKTESLNLDRNGRKLWRLANILNNEDCRSKETVIQASWKVVTGKDAANIFVDIFAQVSQIPILPARKQEVFAETEVLMGWTTAPKEHMSSSLTMKKREMAIHSLKQRKSQGPDGVTNDMLRRLGPVAKAVLKSMNTSWRQEKSHKCGKKPRWFLSQKW
jgi:hypothetical protein